MPPVKSYLQCFPEDVLQPQHDEANRTRHTVLVDGTPDYLFNSVAAPRIRAMVPHARFVVVLRVCLARCAPPQAPIYLPSSNLLELSGQATTPLRVLQAPSCQDNGGRAIQHRQQGPPQVMASVCAGPRGQGILRLEDDPTNAVPNVGHAVQHARLCRGGRAGHACEQLQWLPV
jgi:hypothetical protein